MAERLYYSIGEVSEMLDISMPTIRYWEKEFPFTEPKKSDKGTRYYTQKDIENIQLVQYLLKDKKLTIEGARQLLKNDKEKLDRTHTIVLKLRKIQKEIRLLKEELTASMHLEENPKEEEEENLIHNS